MNPVLFITPARVRSLQSSKEAHVGGRLESFPCVSLCSSPLPKPPASIQQQRREAPPLPRVHLGEAEDRPREFGRAWRPFAATHRVPMTTSEKDDVQCVIGSHFLELKPTCTALLRDQQKAMLTTQHQNCYREQIQKETLTRLAWKRRYADLYPSCGGSEATRRPGSPNPKPAFMYSCSSLMTSVCYSHQPPLAEADGCHTNVPWVPLMKLLFYAPPPRAVLPPVAGTTRKQSDLPPPPPPPPPRLPELPLSVAPLMRPVSLQTRSAVYQDSSHHGKGRSLYLQKRGQLKPEEKFDFPLLSSWEYGWRLGEFRAPKPAGTDGGVKGHLRYSSTRSRFFYAKVTNWKRERRQCEDVSCQN
ncbi:uncharacterized protein AB9W97_011914 isoform 2-T2 [Spinachia spinachia]